MLTMKTHSSEEGSFAILFSFLLGSGLILALVLLAFDTGNMAVQRRKLQNLAQASALAIARDCALAPSTCQSNARQNAETLATGNETFTQSIDGICGYGVGTQLTPCSSGPNPSTITDSSNCRDVPNGTSFVRVSTKALLKDSSGTQRNYLESLFGGARYYISGCAQATWGSANSSGIYMPFAYSYCDWLTSIAKPAGTVIGPILEADNTTQTCASPTKTAIKGWLGIDLTNTSGISSSSQPAGVSCPNPDSAETPATIVIGDVLQSIPRDENSKNLCKVQTSNGQGNKDYLPLFSKMASWSGKKLFLPLITTAGSGQSAIHTVVGFTQFELFAYSFKNQSGGVAGFDTPACTNNDFCIWGKFSKAISPGSTITGSSNALGTDVQAIKLI